MVTVTDLSLPTDEFHWLRELVLQHAGICLQESKLSLLQSRLLKRLRHHGHASFAEYCEFLKFRDRQGLELQEMINAVTTNKTSFFRESHHFDILRDTVLSPALQTAAQGRTPSLRVWSAGCSSGEEAYSAAITIAHTLSRPAAWDIRILASDIDTEMVERAREGVYPRESVSEIPRDILTRYFLSGSGQYSGYVCVKPEIRRMVTFARLNLMDDPWPMQRKLDAIFCRNVIIYFDRTSQGRLLERFARALKPSGIFFSGHSENLFWLGDLFEPIGHTAYRLRKPKSEMPELK